MLAFIAILIVLIIIMVIVVITKIRSEKYTGTQFFNKPLPLQKIKQGNTPCSLNDRFYGGRKIFTFDDYLKVVEKTYSMITDKVSLKGYNFRELTLNEFNKLVLPERSINNFLNKRLNQVPYNKIEYCGTQEEFSVQDPKPKVLICRNTGAYLYQYYFTLHNAKRESSLNSLAVLLYEKDTLKLVNIKTATSFKTTESNGYDEKYQCNYSKFNDCYDISTTEAVPPGLF